MEGAAITWLAWRWWISYLSPQEVARFNNSGKVKVTCTVRVHFSISTYADYVDCDVIPMQACSLLLGRPWQFDKNSIHHCRNNKYTLVHKDKNITLLPMTPNSILKDDINRANKAKHEKNKRLWQKNLSNK